MGDQNTAKKLEKTLIKRMLPMIYHCILFLTDILFLRSVVKKGVPPLRFFYLLAQVFFAALLLAAVLSIWLSGKISGDLAVHGLAWHGSFFILATAVFSMYKNLRQASQKWSWLFSSLLALFGILYFCIAFDALVYEPTALQVKHLTINTQKITKPMRIVFVTDIQTDKVGGYERSMLEKVKEQNADLILFGGDYIQANDTEKVAADLNKLLQEICLQAPLGVFAVIGNHEWHNAVHHIFDGTGVQVRRQTSIIDAGEIRLTFLSLGSSVHAHAVPDYYQDGHFRVMVGHSPVYATAAQQADLLLAGHTHGGQVRVPFYGQLITNCSIPKSWASGITHLSKDSTLIVSNGTGMERGRAPRVRFLCRPDFWVIDLMPVTSERTF